MMMLGDWAEGPFYMAPQAFQETWFSSWGDREPLNSVLGRGAMGPDISLRKFTLLGETGGN